MIAKHSLEILKEGIENRLFSGAGFALISKNKKSGIGTLGRVDFDPENNRINRDTLFDIASLTKPLATSMALFQLQEDGLNLETPISKYFPNNPNMAEITIEHLMLHVSGLPPVPNNLGGDPIQNALNSSLDSKPGSSRNYSDTGYILLSEIVKIESGLTTDKYFSTKIAYPLHLEHSGYKPDIAKSIAATSEDESLDGLPHDPLAREMDGIAGHAGLFMSIDDLALYTRALLGQGKALLNSENFDKLFVSSVSYPAACHSGAFYCHGNPYLPEVKGFSQNRVGHSGFTGCFLVIDRPTESALCLLTNRVLNTTSDQQTFLSWRKSWLEAASYDLGL